MQLAAIADVHGNVLALEAVLSDIRRHGADLVLNLGDCVSGPLWPRETMELLAEIDLPTVRGNHDRQVALTPRALMAPSDAFAFDALAPGQRERLGTYPETLVPASGILAFHAAPTDDNLYLTEDVVGGQMTLAPPETIRLRLAGARAPLVLCGHSHVPRVVRGPGGMLIVNPGSVGAPGYADDAPPAHVSEAGSPHARYALMTRDQDGVWRVALMAVAYDWTAAAARAEENGRPEWARALATGFVR